VQALTDIAPYVAVGAAALAVVLLVLVIVLWAGLRKVRRAQVVVMGRHEQRDIVAEVMSLDSQVRNLREAVEILTDQLDEHKAHLDRALTNRAILRYDAFRDAGGEQSASFALLDNYRSGVVFSAIAARDFARIYVKHLDHGRSDRDLSPEEVQVVAAAVPAPLARGEDGPRALRAPDAGPRVPLPAAHPEEQFNPDQVELPLEPPVPKAPAPALAIDTAGADPAAARRAFDALADAEDADEFTWDALPPRGAAPADGAARREAGPDAHAGGPV
jgi:hypothetical protein